MLSQAGYTSRVLQCQEKNIHGTITGQRQESPVLFFVRLWAQAPEEIIRKVGWVPVELWAFAQSRSLLISCLSQHSLQTF